MRVYNYGTLKKFRYGVSLSIAPSWVCNFNCKYCSLKIPDGTFPHDTVAHTFEEWKEFLDKFPFRLKEVAIAGGEPTLVNFNVPLANWLLRKGVFVQFYTNLSNPHELLKLNKSIRLRILATYHRGQISREQYVRNYAMLVGYQVFSRSLGAKKDFEFSRNRRWTDIEEISIVRKKVLVIGPDFKIFRNCFEAFNAYK